TFSVLLAAGLDGIERGMELQPESSDNIYELTSAQRREAGIETLPTDLGEAVAAMEACSLVLDTLGDRVTSYFLANKRREWRQYNEQVTAFELDHYLPIL
ncbi:MAG TPA: hypothetical protein VJ978_03200, partial [Nitriliruptoraceae bacterium]|nr:hypothetical protein [Nitriliruptoraceae bacterium]